MTTAGEAVVGGGIQIAGEATVGGYGAGDGVVVVPGPAGRRLVELADVEVADGPEPTVLVRDPATGIFHSRPLSEVETRQRGSTVWYLEQAPPHVLPDEWQVDDWVAVIAGEHAGQVYRITEE